MKSPESGEGEENSSSGSSSDDEPAFVNSLARSQPPQKKQKRGEPVTFEALQQAGFDGGPSLAEVAERLGVERRKQQEAAHAAAEEARQREAEAEAEEDAERRLRQAKKQQSPAESLRQALESRTHTITQGERRGATLRAQADAALDFKFAAGQAQDVAAYAGALRKEEDRRKG